MISDQNTNYIYFSEILKADSKYSETVKQLTEELNHLKVKFSFLPNTKDIWARDYMPVQISENEFVEYRYDPDYLQKYRSLKTYPDIVCDSINLNTTKSDLIIDGGNVVKSSNCIILTDKVVKENKHQYSKTELVKKLHDTFKVEKVVLIPWDIKEEYGHSDGVLRFIDDETVLVNEIYEPERKLFQTLKQNGLASEILKVKIRRNNKWNWAYINFLQTKDLILIPKFNIDEDENALEQIAKYFPEYAKNNRILQIEMTEIAKLGGALNCISWTIKI